MRKLFALALAISPIATAHAQAMPADTYQAAVAARRAGDAASAVALLTPLIAANPRNADAQVQMGFAQLALGALDAAETAFSAALAVAPDYDDARIGLARVAQRRGDRAGALRVLESVDPTHPDLAPLRHQLADTPAPRRWQMDVEAAYSWVDGPQPDWRELAAQIRGPVSEATKIGARIEYARRFDRNDVYGEMQLDTRLSDAARIYATLGATPDADFKPEWQVGLGGALRINAGPYATVATIDARQARYAVGDVQSIAPGIEQYIDGHFWITARWINLFDENGHHRSGYLVRGDLQPTDAFRVFLGFSDAPDTDEGIVVDVRSLFGGVNVDIGGGHVLRLSIAHDNRATGPDRTQLTMGFGLRF